MRLIGMLDSPYVRRVAISLSELGHDFDHEPISVFSDFGEFGRINPVVRAPTLVLDDDAVLMDSSIIIEQFESFSPAERSLWPRDKVGRSRCAAVLGLALAACDKAVQLVYERELRPPDKQHGDWAERVSGQVSAACRLLNEQPEEKDLWLARGRPTQAGLTLAVACTFMQHLIPDVWAEAGLPHLRRFQEDVEALPIFRRWPHSGVEPEQQDSPEQ